MNKGEKKTPAVAFNPFDQLSAEDKKWLREVLTDRRYLRMLGLAQKFRPSANCAKAGSTERDQFSNERAAARLSEMLGWALYETAIFAVLQDKLPSRPAPSVNYPHSGTIESEWEQHAAQ